MEKSLLFVKLSERATPPKKLTEESAGFDLCSAYDYDIGKDSSMVVKTDLVLRVPEGTYGRIAPRSGLAVTNMVSIGGGVIDRDYRGNVGIIIFNHGAENLKISTGDRIAQLICEKIENCPILEVFEMETTTRGKLGFGSTGNR